MNITLLCFAALKDFFPASENLHLDKIGTVADLKEFLQSKEPKAAELLEVSRFAVNQSIVNEQDLLVDGSVVAVLPPSSGG
ncbi:molybdopterin synthase sulfur carrier subunit [Leptospira perolatii]|uniref:Molybdopterin synthase sulfur carrier subunit n=1 Tax=Leptospira perolatii TaxID=2023191 RepID=A0A2M9ZMF0_9LEPT|nr:MoaD/ThiS family protein [Leptospira perolatii]PJZ70068.1 molybdopterin synthase sulfur carrier subunit [Leptospira perolatii]PJZ73256.1 molybdopterin synthase sulfur carrier subunit [Leptospira perolatii]